MSNSVPPEWSRHAAVRDESQSSEPIGRPLPDFEPVSPIEREIARSERASAALAAAAAVARAAFTDSQLQAEAAAAEAGEDIDTTAWIRTEYASLDHSLAARSRFDAAARQAGDALSASRNPVVGTFDPGLTALNARVFPGSSIASGRPGAPAHAGSGAQARFLAESRLTPRAAKSSSTTARAEEQLTAAAVHYDKPEVMPMLAMPMPAPAPRAPIAKAAPTGDPAKLVLAACMGAAIALIAGGVAWKSGVLSRAGSPVDSAVVTASVARQAEAARVLGSGTQEIQMAPPSAGVHATAVATTAAPATPADVDAILAAARAATATTSAGPAPAAAVPAAPTPAAVATPPRVVAKVAAPATAAAGSRGKDAVALAIANAQARADNFLATNTAAVGGPAAKQVP